MIGMQQKDPVHGLGQRWADLILLARCGEHHVQEILGVTKVIAWVNKGLALSMLEAHCRQRWHFRNQPMGRNHAMLWVIDVQRVVIERGQCPDHSTHNRHWMGVGSETLEEGTQLFIHHSVIFDGMNELGFCGSAG